MSSATPQTTKLADMLTLLKQNEEVPTPYARQPAASSSSSASTKVSATSNKGGVASLNSTYNTQTHMLGDEPIDVCNCRKSRCLKLYCQCFAASITCTKECNCYSCANNKTHEELRKKAIRIILERNPNAFDSKFKTAVASGNEAAVAHKVGCRCRKSMCLKKYCECYQAGVVCSSTCTCLHCCNTGNAAAAILLQNQRAQPATPIPDNEDAIIKAAEELAFLSQQQQQKLSPTLKVEEIMGAATGPKGASIAKHTSSRPPLPPNKRKRSDSNLDSDGARMSLRAKAVPGRYSDLNDGRPPLPNGFSPIAYAPSRPVDVVQRQPVTMFTLRAASPTSINIASALSLLSAPNNKSLPYPLTVVTDIDDTFTASNTATSSQSQPTHSTDATSEEDDWSEPSPISCHGAERLEENVSRSSSLGSTIG